MATSIKNIEIEPLNIALDAPFTIATGTKENIENVLITLELDNGVIARGEAAPLEPINGESQATVLAVLNNCRDMLMGADVADFRNISARLKGVYGQQVTARCAVEMALLDGFTRSHNMPLYHFFGGSESTLETDYTVDIVDAATAKRNAAALAGRGYRILKTKVGKNLQEDIARILAIKAGAPDCEITLDANQGFTPSEALYCLEELERAGIRPILFEQPVRRDDLAGMRFVKERTSIPVAADESVFTAADALRVAEARCADVINIKLMKSAMLEAVEIAAIARAANLELMVGCMLESRLGMMAAVHLATGLGGFSYVDLDLHGDSERDPFSGGPDFTDPLYTMNPKLPGIGVERLSS